MLASKNTLKAKSYSISNFDIAFIDVEFKLSLGKGILLELSQGCISLCYDIIRVDSIVLL